MTTVCKHFPSNRLFRFVFMRKLRKVNKLWYKNYTTTEKQLSKKNHVGLAFACGIVSMAYLYAYVGLPKIFLEKRNVTVLKSAPNIPISRRVLGKNTDQTLKIIFYQHPVCPFCSKVRALLDYHSMSYDIVEVNTLWPQELSWSDTKSVPNILVNVEGGFVQLVDSAVIISALASYLQDPGQNFMDIVAFYSRGSLQDDRRYRLKSSKRSKKSKDSTVEEEENWRQWADTSLVRALTSNIYKTWKDAVEAFEWFSEAGDWERLFPVEKSIMVYSGAFYKWKNEKTLLDPRTFLISECNNWIKAIREQNAGVFLGGENPNLADLAVYGFLTTIEGCSIFKELLEESDIKVWYIPMKELMDSRRGLVLDA